MPVMILKICKISLMTHALAWLGILALGFLVCLHIPLFVNKRWCGIDAIMCSGAVICIFLLIRALCIDAYTAPREDVNIACVNTSFSESITPESSVISQKTVENNITSSEYRMLYKDHDLEKTIDGNRYFIFTLNKNQTDKENVEEIVKKYNKKYNKNIDTKDLTVVKKVK